MNRGDAAIGATNSTGVTNGAASSVTGANATKPGAVSTDGRRRVAIPVANGWLVFQL
jgi:hypothetical protein